MATETPVSALAMYVRTHANRFRLDEAHVMVLSVRESVLIHHAVLACGCMSEGIPIIASKTHWQFQSSRQALATRRGSHEQTTD